MREGTTGASESPISASQIFVNGFRGATACAHGENDRGTAGDDVASGKDTFARCLLRGFIGLDVAALVSAKTGRRALDDGIRAGSDGDYGHG